jgi:cytochrome c oxidase cbb3-type subunit 2
MIANARSDLAAQARPEADAAGFQGRYGARARQAAFDGDPGAVTEMDAWWPTCRCWVRCAVRDVTPEQVRQQ